MDHAKAVQILAAEAPELIASADTSMPHIAVYKADDQGKPAGAPFCIMLPKSTEATPMNEPEEEKLLISAIVAAKEHLGA